MPRLKLEVEKPGMCVEFNDPKNGEVKHVEALLPFYEIKKLKRGNANVRPPKEDRKPFKAMLETIENHPDDFHIKNRGITYICTAIEYDKKEGVLTIDVPDDTEIRKGQKEDLSMRYGIADGGHTFEAITRTVSNEKDYAAMEKWTMPFGRVHFIATRDLKNVEPIVEALNTSTQVQQVTLDEYQNKFASMKLALRDAHFDTDTVAFREGENKPWKVEEIIQRMSCFLPERWVRHQPTNMYKSKNKARKLFTDEESRMEFKEIYPVIADVITLPEYVQSRFSRMVEAKFQKKVPAGCKRLNESYTRENTKYPTMHKFNASIILPVASAFRVLLVKKGDTYDWALDPREVFDHVEEQLFNLYTKKSNKYDIISQISNDPAYWGDAMEIVEEAKREMLSSGPIVRRKNEESTGEADSQDQDNQEVLDVAANEE